MFDVLRQLPPGDLAADAVFGIVVGTAADPEPVTAIVRSAGGTVAFAAQPTDAIGEDSPKARLIQRLVEAFGGSDH